MKVKENVLQPSSLYSLNPVCQEAKSGIVVRLGELLTAADMDDVQVIPRARVPVCKASFKGISFDVTVSLACRDFSPSLCPSDPLLPTLKFVLAHR